ncbi:MAG: hypothetical protein M1840_006684 [Geoglossum simile]|nr:MAG: hypothetical protein M1840_006684 [Geoglossum simile]
MSETRESRQIVIIVRSQDPRYNASKRYRRSCRTVTELLVIIELMKRHSSVAGRATTCWKAYCDRDKSKQMLVIKDSRQYLERREEGELLHDETEKGVFNVARYYYYETVRIGRKDDINGNIRKGLGITKATSKTEGMMAPLSTSGGVALVLVTRVKTAFQISGSDAGLMTRSSSGIIDLTFASFESSWK